MTVPIPNGLGTRSAQYEETPIFVNAKTFKSVFFDHKTIKTSIVLQQSLVE